MESLIARLRLVVVFANLVMLAFFFDTQGWHTSLAWFMVVAALGYGIPIVVLQPYRRWRVFQTSIITAILDTATIAPFIAVTGGDASPYYLLYFLSLVAVGMRFELRQVLAVCGLYSATYAVVYLWSWDPGADALGQLALRCIYLFIVGVAVGHLAREESSRSMQVEAFEKLNQENRKLLTKREKEARVDRLTGLTNRASLEKDAHKALRRVRQTGGYLSVLFCDMDRLKAINDELGHDAGDRVLRQAGHVMKRALRAQDLVGRYGGDEFVVVLPNLTRETAFERADHLIAGFKQINEMLPEDLHVGLSVGIATYPFDAEDYPTLVKLADQAMYLAKRDGGNRVRTANDLRLFWETIPRTA
ncbi:MAG: GGDEF domain-containing protein [Chloroflexi bacterium]|nr:GGDEF domain-containing protein [Chloroflexota bacterium]